MPKGHTLMKVTKKQLRRLIKEELAGQYGEDYLSLTHSDGEGELADPELDDSQPEKERTHSHEHSHDDQGYDDREDESLAAKHGAASRHDQDYSDRRDDADFEVRKENKIRISKHRLQAIIREERARLLEDSTSDELDHLRKNIDDDKDHIDNLEKDIKDDREEMERAHEDERKKNESFRGRTFKRRLKRVVREACALSDASDEVALDISSVPDVPSPEDYASVRGLLDQNPELVDLGLSMVMDAAGASCERSTAQGVIDHLQDMLATETEEAPSIIDALADTGYSPEAALDISL